MIFYDLFNRWFERAWEHRLWQRAKTAHDKGQWLTTAYVTARDGGSLNYTAYLPDEPEVLGPLNQVIAGVVRKYARPGFEVKEYWAVVRINGWTYSTCGNGLCIPLEFEAPLAELEHQT